MPPSPNDEKIKELYINGEDVTAMLATDEYGFVVDKFKTSHETYSSIKMQWYLLIDSYGCDRKKFKAAVRKNHLLEKGIPLSLKNRIWKDLVYSKNNADYDTLKNTDCKYEYQIHVDIQRTFRHHFLFFKQYGKGQSELFSVLTALANHDTAVGYCQGMSDICAVLLMYFSEKEAFDMYLALVKKNGLRELFDANLSKLPKIMKLQNTVFSSAIPRIHRHLRSQNVDFSIYGTGWYMTLFSRFHIKLVLRIWDFLFFCGFNVLMYFAAAILRYHEKDILERESEQLLEFIGKLNDAEVDEDIVVSLTVGFMKELHYKFSE